ncbi:MAG: DNA translocase FtsK 4TM domain-containing protein, partial [Rhodoferax sp.]
MTYSLNTFNASETDTARHGLIRFAKEIGLFFGFVGLALWIMALLTYTPQDPAWSTSGAGGATQNLAGQLGAWLADASYFLLGFSVWWC